MIQDHDHCVICEHCEAHEAPELHEFGSRCEACYGVLCRSEAKACPSCGCPLVARVPYVPGEWAWGIVDLVTKQVAAIPIHYCPEHGCDLEAEFHMALRKKARKA